TSHVAFHRAVRGGHLAGGPDGRVLRRVRRVCSSDAATDQWGIPGGARGREPVAARGCGGCASFPSSNGRPGRDIEECEEDLRRFDVLHTRALPDGAASAHHAAYI